MSPPAALRGRLELADIFRAHGDLLPALSPHQSRVVEAITSCRTAALGGHVWECDHCGTCFWMNYCRFLTEIVVQKREETVDEDITIDISIDTNTFGDILSIRSEKE